MKYKQAGCLEGEASALLVKHCICFSQYKDSNMSLLDQIKYAKAEDILDEVLRCLTFIMKHKNDKSIDQIFFSVEKIKDSKLNIDFHKNRDIYEFMTQPIFQFKALYYKHTEVKNEEPVSEVSKMKKILRKIIPQKNEGIRRLDTREEIKQIYDYLLTKNLDRVVLATPEFTYEHKMKEINSSEKAAKATQNIYDLPKSLQDALWQTSIDQPVKNMAFQISHPLHVTRTLQSSTSEANLESLEDDEISDVNSHPLESRLLAQVFNALRQTELVKKKL